MVLLLLGNYSNDLYEFWTLRKTTRTTTKTTTRTLEQARTIGNYVPYEPDLWLGHRVAAKLLLMKPGQCGLGDDSMGDAPLHL